MPTLLANESSLRFVILSGVLVAMLIWERASPLRVAAQNRLQRDANNLGLLLIDVVAVRLLLPGSLVGVAFYAADADIGLANVVTLPLWLGSACAIILLDAAIYGQHVLFHVVTPLWRLHRVHHTDRDLDVTSAVRFHPVEILVSLFYKAIIVMLLGAPPEAVIVFEILLSAMAMFNHANVRISPAIDRYMRWVLVTPRMHWIHHSVVPIESQHNFGFCLSWWDRMFATYKSAPGAGYAAMLLGVRGFSGGRATRLLQLLWQPCYPNGEDRR